MTGSTDLGLHYNLGMHQEGVGYNWLYPGGGWDDQRLLRGAPLFPFEGGLYTGAKWALHHLAPV